MNSVATLMTSRMVSLQPEQHARIPTTSPINQTLGHQKMAALHFAAGSLHVQDCLVAKAWWLLGRAEHCTLLLALYM
jgi:hypothetical protein